MNGIPVILYGTEKEREKRVSTHKSGFSLGSRLSNWIQTRQDDMNMIESVNNEMPSCSNDSPLIS